MPRAKRPLAKLGADATNTCTKAIKVEAETSAGIDKRCKTEIIETLPRRNSRRISGRVIKQEPSHPSASGKDAELAGAGEEAKKEDPTAAAGHRAVSYELEEIPRFIETETIEYRKKDNNKLRRLLMERWMSSSGTREDMIARLENSWSDYTILKSDELSAMLKNRNLTNASCGSKEVKIQRLRINDLSHRDTGNSSDRVLHSRLSVFEMIERQLSSVCTEEQAMDENNNPHVNMAPSKLLRELEKRHLAKSGTKNTQIKRLLKNNRKSTANHLRDIRKQNAATKAKLEASTGYPVNATEMDELKRRISALDHQAQAAVKRGPPKHICDYDWKKSHWADRTERELNEICHRRGMPGYGPKASKINGSRRARLGMKICMLHRCWASA
ncbi:hypothetical protein PVAG01_09421 [Phlyctema vagabunda]|uniref:Uncharacterized protein n=1 Tax=Phlyctema vagabunda TaxID=108571 RepID=A0ABR4P7A6_9HELO